MKNMTASSIDRSRFRRLFRLLLVAVGITGLLLVAPPPGNALCLEDGQEDVPKKGPKKGPEEEGEPKFVRCTKCKNLGAKPCPEHKKADCDLENNVLCCRFVADCTVCGGTGWIDCEHCTNEATEERLRRKREGVPAIRESFLEFDEAVGRRVRVAESEHFVVVCELDGMKVEKKKLNDHQLLHLYIDRLETLFADYLEVLGVDESAFKTKSRVLLWRNPDDHEKASLRLCTFTGESGVKYLGAFPTYCVPVTKKDFKNDETLHRNVIHSTVHLLLSHQAPINWIGDKKGGWADAGLAHWFEDRYWGVCDNYCYQEVNTQHSFKGGKWKPALRKMVAMDRTPSLASLFQQNTTTLTVEQHSVSFSLVDYLLATDAEKTNRVFMRLRAKTPTRDALKEVFGVTVPRLEEQWKQWVLATYPAR
jgi:hypothetical protein